MQGEFLSDVAPLARRDQLAVGETDRMQRPLDVLLPKLDEAEEARMIGCQIILLPDEAVEPISVICVPKTCSTRARSLAPISSDR